MDIENYVPSSWFTAEGLHRKRKEIESRGIPDLTNWRFITLTLNQTLFDDELDGYLTATDHMRRFTQKLREYFGDDFEDGKLKNCRKLEFHTNVGSFGWPHWHMGLNVTRKLTETELDLLTKWWGLGRVNVKRITGATLGYFFKYVFKSPFTGSECVPDWFADYQNSKGDTFFRARFWQTSQGFYTGKPQDAEEQGEQQWCFVPLTVRERIEYLKTCVRFIATTSERQYLVSGVVSLDTDKQEFFSHLNRLILNGEAVHTFNNKIRTAKTNIEQYIPLWQRNQSKPLQQDRLRATNRKLRNYQVHSIPS